ncbi:MAG TPA: hypothetical protein VK005_01085 [Acholeplasma sp.]|nr:hypothetical protein [Acholeplasma sp.]
MSRMLPSQSGRNIKKATLQPDVEPQDMKDESFKKSVLMSRWSIYSALAVLVIGVSIVVIVLSVKPNPRDTTKVFEYLEKETLAYNESPILFLETSDNVELVIYYGITGDTVDSHKNLLLVHVVNNAESVLIKNDVYLNTTIIKTVNYQYSDQNSYFYVIEIDEDLVDVDFLINGESNRQTFNFETYLEDLNLEELE